MYVHVSVPIPLLEASGVPQGTGSTWQGVGPVTQPLTSSVGTIPEDDMYTSGGVTTFVSGRDAFLPVVAICILFGEVINLFSNPRQAISNAVQPPSDQQEIQALKARVESLRSEEAVICSSLEQKRQEEEELEERVVHLKREETRLKKICEEREQQMAALSEERLMDVC